MEEKMIIYQVFTRLFGNKGLRNKMNGTLEENGCGKMDDFTEKALHEIKKLGATHIWYTGIIAANRLFGIRHSTQSSGYREREGWFALRHPGLL